MTLRRSSRRPFSRTRAFTARFARLGVSPQRPAGPESWRAGTLRDRRSCRASCDHRADTGPAPQRRHGRPDRRWALPRRASPARFVELPGDEHYPFVGDVERVVDGSKSSSPGSDRAVRSTGRSRRFFTDIVHSTERAAALGDRRWHDYSNGTTTPSVESSSASADGKSMPPGTASSRLSMARRAASAAPRRYPRRSGPARVGGPFGLHTGECELFDDDIGGIAVHIAARVSALAGGRGCSSPAPLRTSWSARRSSSPRGWDPAQGHPWSLAAVRARVRLGVAAGWQPIPRRP